jgi:hypothetical protein
VPGGEMVMGFIRDVPEAKPWIKTELNTPSWREADPLPVDESPRPMHVSWCEDETCWCNRGDGGVRSTTTPA